MVTVLWQDTRYDVSRVVMSDDIRSRFQSALAPVVERYGLTHADELATPRPGDFWIGCSPRNGWREPDPFRTAWASSLEIRDALASLTAVLPRYRREAFSLVRLLYPKPAAAKLAFE